MCNGYVNVHTDNYAETYVSKFSSSFGTGVIAQALQPIICSILWLYIIGGFFFSFVKIDEFFYKNCEDNYSDLKK